MTDDELKAIKEQHEQADADVRIQWNRTGLRPNAYYETLLDEVERLREENRHHRVTATNSVSKSLHDAAIAEQAVEIARLHRAHETACLGGDLLREEIVRLREALEDIARGDYSDPMCERTPEQRAREALESGR